MKVAVLTGGSSTERELSLASAKNVCAALEEAGHRTVLLDASPDLVSALRVERPDVCFNALHGKLGEDGTVQSLLEFVGVPFVGSPSGVCRRAWDKSSLGSEMAAYRAITGDEPTASWPQGVCIAREAFESMGAATAFDLVEDRVIGGYPVAVKPAHGVSASGVRDTVACRTPGAVELFAPVRPASLSNDEADAQAIRAEIERAALEACRAYQVRDLARVDLMWDGAQARVLEVDVSPSLAESSPFSLACEASGLSLSGVLNELVSQYAR